MYQSLSIQFYSHTINEIICILEHIHLFINKCVEGVCLYIDIFCTILWFLFISCKTMAIHVVFSFGVSVSPSLENGWLDLDQTWYPVAYHTYFKFSKCSSFARTQALSLSGHSSIAARMVSIEKSATADTKECFKLSIVGCLFLHTMPSSTDHNL